MHAVVLAICPTGALFVAAGMRCVLWIGENGLGGREKACGVWGGWLLQVLGCMRLGWVGDSNDVSLCGEVAPVDYYQRFLYGFHFLTPLVLVDVWDKIQKKIAS